MPEDAATKLESKKYNFLVEGTMPVLNFEITSGGKSTTSSVTTRAERQNLSIEIHSPISGEIFEARTPKGRIEVDNDGTVTYFSQEPDCLSFSLFVGKSIIVTMSRKTGEVLIKTPSRILSIEDHRQSVKRKSKNEVFTDTVKLLLE